jgi:fructoselysine-6-P-deglycase FrlB-like protein
MGSGPAFGAAYVFSICNVQEMLQIDSVTTNCCEFFHGPFEVLDKRTSVFLLVSVGRSRANDERAISFLNTYGGKRVYLLDAKEIGLNDLPDTVSEYFNHLIFSPILNNVYMRALSAVTHKDYMTRRYMWKVAY